MHRRGLLAVGASIAVAGCLSSDDSGSAADGNDDRPDTDTQYGDDPARTPAGRRTLTEADRSTIVACERARVRDEAADDADIDPLVRVTSVGPAADGFLRVDLETEWGDHAWQPGIRISGTDRTGLDSVPSSTADPFAGVDGFQDILSDVVLFESVEIAGDEPLYEELRAAIETAYRGFDIGDAVYLEHEGELVRLLSTESGGSPENRVRATYFLSDDELRRVTSEGEETPAAATPIDC